MRLAIDDRDLYNEPESRTMPIFELGDDNIVPLRKTTFASTGHKERDDLQRLLRDQINVIAPDVMVISEEFGNWEDSRRRIDLLCLDKNANLVVVELKRTDDGGHMELQALRYSAMISTITSEQAIDAYASYLQSRDIEDDAEQSILNFLDWTEIDEDSFAQDVRVVLVSADFSRELTTAVIWLNEKELDIRCVRIRPYEYEDRTFIDVQQVVPLPEATDYQVQVREKRRQERASRNSNMDLTRYDITVGGQVFENQWKRNGILLVVKAIVEQGVPVLELFEVFQQLGRSRAFYGVEGELKDIQEFHEIATRQSKEGGKKFTPKRWHMGKDDLIRSDGSTYVFTNQWGSKWPRFMSGLQIHYPGIELDYHPTNS